MITKSLKKAIMKRSKLPNKYLRAKQTGEAKSLYNKQCSICVCILRKNKGDYFENLTNNIFSDKRSFQRTLSPPLLEKAFHKEFI